MYIGNEGFFDDTIGWSELYKIHGDIELPNSIVINSYDYERYDNKSILKILQSACLKNDYVVEFKYFYI
uniref:SIR2 family protein n=1 Tax=Photorhabdus kayaii TaxID=230088 RepID=UPI0036F1BDB5